MVIKNYKQLAKSRQRKQILEIINSGIEACKPEKVVKHSIKIRGHDLFIKQKHYDLNKFKNIYLIGFGKISADVTKELEGILGSRLKKGIVIDKKKIRLNKTEVIKANHPLPSEKNVRATKKIISFIKKLDKNDLLLCIVSGGGSALLCYPKIPFKDYIKKIKKIIFSGIDINELNKIRKKLSKVKDGKLAKLTKAKIIGLIFSDVIGDNLSIVASGPTIAKGVDNILMLNNKVALNAMYLKAASLKLKPEIYSTTLKGEAKNVGKKLIKAVKNKENICLIAGGETTVKVKGKGKGGRNQELCLGAIKYINSCTLASFASDGKDGTTNAAGAIIDKETYKKAKKLNLGIEEHLKNNNSYNFFNTLEKQSFSGPRKSKGFSRETKDLIYSCKTKTNIMDLIVMVKN